MSERVGLGEAPLLPVLRRIGRGPSHDGDRALQIVGQNMQSHLSYDVSKPAHPEVLAAHSILAGERSANLHRRRVLGAGSAMRCSDTAWVNEREATAALWSGSSMV